MKDAGSAIGRFFEVFIVVLLIAFMLVIASMCTGLVALPLYLLFRRLGDRRKVAFWVTYFSVLPFVVSLYFFVDLYINNEIIFLPATLLGALCYLWMRKDAGLSVLSFKNEG